jgi:hypothetical protein
LPEEVENAHRGVEAGCPIPNHRTPQSEGLESIFRKSGLVLSTTYEAGFLVWASRRFEKFWKNFWKTVDRRIQNCYTKIMENKITLEKMVRKGSEENFYLVRRNGFLIGFLSKFKNTRGEIHPWKAFGMRRDFEGAWIVDHGQFKAFYEEHGGKAAAIHQVVKFFDAKFPMFVA